MLQPNTIPDKEPFIRVGVIMPKDGYQLVEIKLLPLSEYRMMSDDKNLSLLPAGNHKFELSGKLIKLDETRGSGFWSIEPKHPYSLGPGQGIKVKNVVVGRGFHWEKSIDMFLPGKIEITVFENNLILTNVLHLEEYIMCVAISEMGAECPAAMIESQTIAARSWLLANIEQKHINMGIDVCNDDCCQRYQGSANLTIEAIASAQRTSGQILLFQNRICDARYSKCCGGMMESFHTIWPGNDLKYLQNIPDAPIGFTHPALPLSNEDKVKEWIDSTPQTFCSTLTVVESNLYKYLGTVDEKGTYFRWHIEYSQSELCKLLSRKLHISMTLILGFEAIKRGGSGRLSQIKIFFLNDDHQENTFLIDSEFKIRDAFHKNFLYSSCFYIVPGADTKGSPDNFKIIGAGWGHGVGYCQIGALGMALNGYTTGEILAHYYPGSEIKNIY